jgi:hypothetical protein
MLVVCRRPFPWLLEAVMNDRDRMAASGPTPADAGSAPPGFESALASGGTGGVALGSTADTARERADTDTLTEGAAASGVAARGGDIPNTTENPRPGAAPAGMAEDVRLRDFARIEPGWSVVASDGEQLSAVVEKGPNWFSLHYGTSDERTMYLPIEYVETVANRRVVLSQPAPLVIDMKLDAPPPENPGLEHRRMSGVEHDPRRGEFEGSLVIPNPVDQPVQSPMPPAGGLSGDVAGAAERQLTGRPGAQATVGGMSPVSTPGHSARMRIDGSDAIADTRAEERVDGEVISRAEADPEQRSGVSTHMDAPVSGEHSTAWDRVNAQDTLGQTFEERSGFTVLSEEQRLDRNDGPTHQPGVKDPRSLEPLRTQFGETGTPGEGRERNITDTDLVKNQHPSGDPFDSQASTVGRPLAPGEPSAANRSKPGTAGLPQPPETRPRDVPPGSVSRPLTKQ